MHLPIDFTVQKVNITFQVNAEKGILSTTYLKFYISKLQNIRLQSVAEQQMTFSKDLHS